MGIFTIIGQEEIDDAIERAIFESFVHCMTMDELLYCANSIDNEVSVRLVYENGHITKPYKVKLLKAKDVCLT